jgi:hypothetical protein
VFLVDKICGIEDDEERFSRQQQVEVMSEEYGWGRRIKNML